MSKTPESNVLDLRDLAPERRKAWVTFVDEESGEREDRQVEMATPNDLTIRQRVELGAAEQRREKLNEKTRTRELTPQDQRKLEKLETKEAEGKLTPSDQLKLEGLRPADLSDEEAGELEKLTNRSAEIVLFTLTAEEVAALPYFQREAVVLDFTLRFGTTIAKLAKAAGGPELAQAMQALEIEATLES